MAVPMEVDTLAVSRKRPASEDRETFRKMLRLNNLYETSAAKTIDYAWSMVDPSKLPQLPGPVTSPIEKEHFYHRTIEQITQSGGGRYVGKKASIFVYNRTMKYMLVYCNEMYKMARKKNKYSIDHLIVHQFFRQEQLVYRDFLLHFFPEPKADMSKNQHSLVTLVHDLYKNNYEVFKLYHNATLKTEKARLARKLEHNLADAHFTGRSYNKYARISYIDDKGMASIPFATMFLRALGMPPLERGMIVVLAFLARMCISEMVRRGVEVAGVGKNITVKDYKKALKNTGDLLFNYDMSHIDPPPEITPRRVESTKELEEVVDYYCVRKNQIDAKLFGDEIKRRRIGETIIKENEWKKLKRRL